MASGPVVISKEILHVISRRPCIQSFKQHVLNRLRLAGFATRALRTRCIRQLELRGSWQASIAVCLGCPWDQTSKLRFGLSIENLTNLASGPFSMLVIWSPRGPRVPMAWGGCASAAGYPIGCQIGSLARHETPLRWRDVRKPPKFRDQIVPAEISGPLRLELPAAKTSSYRYGKFWVDVRARHHGCRRIMPMFL